MRVNWCAMAALTLLSCGAGVEERRLALDEYRDKMMGAWIGQIVGVSFGQPTEFICQDEIIPEKRMPKWTGKDVPFWYAFANDDVFVEVNFLTTLDRYGLDVDIRQAGLEFANMDCILGCANETGRANLRKGVAPPDSSHPAFSRNGNDIDYQIEADYSGIIAPGCPQEPIRLAVIFGRLMNYGDGMLAGAFIGGLYTEAFFTGDIERILDAGCACIPSDSDYAQMVRDVRAWHRECPEWTNCWTRIRGKYSAKFNRALKDSNGGIDVRLNGAMVVMGLLYGNGDILKTMEISMRGGYDSDCNPSNAGGVLMCARGRSKLPGSYTEWLERDFPSAKFQSSGVTLNDLYAISERLARQVVVRHGGRIEKDETGREAFVIPVADAKPCPYVPTWKAPPAQGLRYTELENAQQKYQIRMPNAKSLQDPDPTQRVQKTLDALYPGWKTTVNASDMNPGYREKVDNEGIPGSSVFAYGRVFVTHPPKEGDDVVLTRHLTVPKKLPRLSFYAGNFNVKGAGWELEVRVNGEPVLTEKIALVPRCSWRIPFRRFEVNLDRWAGRDATIELVNHADGWACEAAYWADLLISSADIEK